MDGLERDLEGKADVLRLDVLTRIGRETAVQFGVRGTPTLVLVDGRGVPILTQVGIIRPGPVKSNVDALLSQK